jgi:hypothetical protein
MSRRFDTAFSIAVGRSVVGILGLAVADVLRDVSTVSPTRTTVVYWGLVAISLALVVIGSVWLVVLHARLRRHIAGRQAALDEAALAAFRQDWRTGRSETVWELLHTDQPPNHEPDHGQINPSLAGGTQPLIFAAQPPVEQQPGKCSLHDPPSR